MLATAHRRRSAGPTSTGSDFGALQRLLFVVGSVLAAGLAFIMLFGFIGMTKSAHIGWISLGLATASLALLLTKEVRAFYGANAILAFGVHLGVAFGGGITAIDRLTGCI